MPTHQLRNLHLQEPVTFGPFVRQLGSFGFIATYARNDDIFRAIGTGARQRDYVINVIFITNFDFAIITSSALCGVLAFYILFGMASRRIYYTSATTLLDNPCLVPIVSAPFSATFCPSIWIFSKILELTGFYFVGVATMPLLGSRKECRAVSEIVCFFPGNNFFPVVFSIDAISFVLFGFVIWVCHQFSSFFIDAIPVFVAVLSIMSVYSFLVFVAMGLSLYCAAFLALAAETTNAIFGTKKECTRCGKEISTQPALFGLYKFGIITCHYTGFLLAISSMFYSFILSFFTPENGVNPLTIGVGA